MKINTKQITLVALFLALCLIIPMAFHFVGAGSMFLPMFLPILLSGFLLEFPFALLVGFFGPLMSAFTTGMPQLFPTGLIMSVEGLVVTTVISFLYHKLKISYWLCLIAAIISQRVVLVLMLIAVLPLLDLPAKPFSIGVIIYSIPGIILQLILIPVILKNLWKLNIIENRS